MRFAVADAQDAWVGGGVGENAQVAKVGDLIDTLLFEPFTQGTPVIGTHPLVGDDVAEIAVGSQQFDAALDEIAVEVGSACVDLVEALVIAFVGAKILLADVRRVADDGVETALGEDFGEGALPVEGVDADDLLFVGQKLAGKVVPADEGVAAADVVAEVGQDAVETKGELTGFALEQFEQEGELGDLDRLGVDIDAVDAGGEDALLFFGGEAIFAAFGGDDGWVFAADVAFGVVGEVVVEVPVEEVLVGSEEEGAGTAGGIDDTEFEGLVGGEGGGLIGRNLGLRHFALIG